MKRIKRNPDPVILAAMRRTYWMTAEQISFETSIPTSLAASRMRTLWQRGELDRQPGVGSTMTYRKARPEPEEDEVVDDEDRTEGRPVHGSARAVLDSPLWDLLEHPVITADCVEAMAMMPDCSVDAVVCDPPYGLEFMGKDWDRLAAAPRGRTTEMRVDGPTIETANDTPQHRAAVRQPGYLLRCAVCGGNSSGAWNRCGCARPDFRGRTDLSHAMQEWHHAWATEVFRVLKPGGHLLAFGGTRTYHRLACAVEDAGFEIRDSITWLYGSGFPKSMDVSKAIDKAQRGVPQGGEDPTSPHHGQYRTTTTEGKRWDGDSGRGYGAGGSRFLAATASERTTAPSTSATTDPDAAAVDGQQASTPAATATPDAEGWEGWGTALKPASEPIVVARKPLAGTVAGNVLTYGTGALNIDGCRIGIDTERGERYQGKAPGGGGSIAIAGDRMEPWNGDRSPKKLKAPKKVRPGQLDLLAGGSDG